MPTGRGMSSTSPGEEPHNRDSEMITEIPSRVTQTDFQRQLAQTFSDMSSTQDFRAAHDTMHKPLPAPQPSYGTWHNLASGTQGPLLLTGEDRRVEQAEFTQEPQAPDNTQPHDHQDDSADSDGESVVIAVAPVPVVTRGPRDPLDQPLPPPLPLCDQQQTLPRHLPCERNHHCQQ